MNSIRQLLLFVEFFGLTSLADSTYDNLAVLGLPLDLGFLREIQVVKLIPKKIVDGFASATDKVVVGVCMRVKAGLVPGGGNAPYKAQFIERGQRAVNGVQREHRQLLAHVLENRFRAGVIVGLDQIPQYFKPLVRQA